MTTRGWSRSTTERKAAGNHSGDVAVRKMMWKYDCEDDYENNDEERSTIIADKSQQLTKNSEWCNHC